MKSRRTRSGLDLTEISFGCGAIGGLYRAVSDDQAGAVLSAAWDAGIRYFDTAPFYGHGRSELRLGSFLRDKQRDEYVLSTKVGKLLEPVSDKQVPDYNFVDPLPNDIVFDYTSEGIRRSYESSLERLGANRIEMLFVHDLEPAGHSSADYENHMSDFLSDGINALHALKEAGQITGFGLGVNQVEPCIDILRHVSLDVILLAGRYTLLDRTAEKELLALCEANGTDLVIGGVFNSGILATGARPGAHFDYGEASEEVVAKVSGLERLCQLYDTDLAAAALRFPLTNKLVKSVLVGTAKPSSLARNLAGYRTQVPDTLFADVDAGGLALKL